VAVLVYVIIQMLKYLLTFVVQFQNWEECLYNTIKGNCVVHIGYVNL
jgi:hypothetical protein